MMDTDGDGTPDTPWPTVAQDRSRRGASRRSATTDEHACLRCHEHARTGYKRGTLFVEGHDVHATAATGRVRRAPRTSAPSATRPSHHKFVRGHMVGGDLAAADYPPPPPGVARGPERPDRPDLRARATTSADLPSRHPHGERHLAMIACETCHIPYGSGITYSLFGHGGQVSFGRNADGRDTKLVVADMYVAERQGRPRRRLRGATGPARSLTWFNGGTSFLAQSLAVRGMPNAKITPVQAHGERHGVRRALLQRR